MNKAPHAKSAAQAPAAGLAPGLDPRYVWLAIAALIFTLGTWLALTQDPRPNPLSPVQTLSPDWWRFPVERNAFKRLPVIDGELNAVHAHPGGRDIWAVGNAGLIVHSADGGRAWERQDWTAAPGPATRPEALPAPAPRVEDLKAPPSKGQRGSGLPSLFSEAQAGEPPAAARTPNRAATPNEASAPVKPLDPKWQGYPSPAANAPAVDKSPPSALKDAVIVPSNRAGGGPADTASGSTGGGWGDSVAPVVPDEPTPNPPDLRAVFFLPDARTGWAVGDGGTVLKTSDSGTTWTPQRSGTEFALFAVVFTDASIGLAVGDAGTILQTSDGGASWTAQASAYGSILYSAAFTDARSAWVVGYPNTILHTSDGGASWTPQPSGSAAALTSVAFTNARSGWAVSRRGEILHTDDAGASWVPQVSGTPAWLAAVVFTDDQTGWAVGENGVILHTTDAGKSWGFQASLSQATLNAVAFTDARIGWAVGDKGTILHTTDGGATWVLAASGEQVWLDALVFADGRNGWAVGSVGTILHTSDRGVSWAPQASGTTSWLRAVAFPDVRTGWAVGSEGILHTTDGGTSWTTQISDTEGYFKAVAFADARTGWAVAGMNVLRTTDGGTSWSSHDLGTTQRGLGVDSLASVAFVDSRTGWVVGDNGIDNGIIRHTTDGGDSWIDQKRPNEPGLRSVTFVNVSTGWAVGSNGAIIHTNDAGGSWTDQTSGVKFELDSVAFADARAGWAVGQAGTILHTSDAGATWAPQASGTGFWLRSVAFTDTRTGWAVGTDAILHTTDGGQTWLGGELPGSRPFLFYARFPAPWWYLTLFAGLGGIGMALRPPQPRVRSVASVADLALSDRPLEAGDRDALDFRPIALGLSSFLRNTATEPPLTLAITGDWGSGKSSLMNLLRGDLRTRGFRPVWFNAWHQPKDVNLLAALVSTIQAQAVPPLGSAAGLRFRWQLVWQRTRGRPVWTAAMVFLAAWLVTYFGMEPAHLTAAIQWLPQVARALTDEDGKSAAALLTQFKSFAALVAVLGPVLAAWHGLQAFGAKPTALVASLAGGLKQAVAGSRFLNDYARQFQTVANALRPRTLTIFIDDLDRCPPERVREALEAVNYLVSSGPCFIVLGMARERVEACVGIAFQDVAQEMANLARLAVGAASAVPEGPDDEARRHRRHYARDYLKKLVNIEVPVPQPSDPQAKALVGPAAAPPPEPLWRALARAAGRAWPLVMVVAMLVLGWWSGVQTPDVAPPQAEPAAEVADTAAGAGPVAPQTQGRPDRAGTEPDAKPSQAASLVPGQTAPVPMTAWLVPLFLLLAATGVTLLHRPPVVERDSRTFREALTNWLPLVAARQNTPREVKRFVNRVRLLAMRQRAEGQDAAVLDEPTLVALGALHHLDDTLLEAPPAPDSGAATGAALAGLGHDWATRIAQPLDQALDTHTKGAGWPPAPDQIALFRKLVGSVRLD